MAPPVPGAATPRDGRRALLRLHRVSKTFAGQLALDAVSLTVFRGEICALLGPNGSGKSTLIKILAGYHRADPGGQVSYEDGSPQLLEGGGAQWRRHLRFIHQDLGLVDSLDALDNLALSPERFGSGSATKPIDWRRQARAARALLAELGVEIDLRQPVGRLSAVERSMVAVARALRGFADRHGLLVLDEPTASMSGAEVTRLFDVLRQLEGRGVAILIVSHRLDEVYDLAERAIVLRDGRLVGEFEIAATPQQTLIESITGTRPAARANTPRRPARTCALAVRGLTGGRIDDLSFTVRSGEIVGVAGLAGSGRDALANLIYAGSPSAGQIEINGRAHARLGPREALAAGLALIPADRGRSALLTTMSSGENLTLPRLRPFWRAGRLRHADELVEAAAWMSRVQVTPANPHLPVSNLSGGNQQKLVLARWLRIEPQVLVLDEPTQGVDIGAKALIYELIRAAAARGLAALVCSSEADELATLCDRVLVMRAGRLAAELSGADLQAARIVAASLRPE